MYKITDMSKYAILLKRMKIRYKHCILRLIRMQMNGYIPLHVHMHLCRPSVMTIWVWVPLWHMMFPATGPKNTTKITSGY